MTTSVEFTPKKTRHVVHGIMTLLTGVWIVVWITAAVCNSGAYERKETFTSN